MVLAEDADSFISHRRGKELPMHRSASEFVIGARIIFADGVIDN